MKIALCLEYPIALHGGVSVLVETLAQEFTARGHEIVLVSPDAPDDLENFNSHNQIRQHIQIVSGKFSIAGAKKLARQIANANIDVAHFHFGGVFGWGNRFPFHCPMTHLAALGVPCFSTVHLVVELTEGYCGPQKPFWFKSLMLPLGWSGKMQQLFHAHREIAVSQHDFKKLCRWYWPLKNRFTQIYHSRLHNEPLAQNLSREKIILNVGHIAWRKGQMVLAQAFAKIAPHHPEWNLQLAGYDADDISARQIRSLIAEQKLENRIFLLGDRPDALDLIKRAAIYVQPSFWEALGLALQEAMFVGCACIGSRAGGIPDLISENENGLLFEPGNIAQLADALEKLIGDETRRAQLGRAAANSIRERGMTAGQMAENYLRLYESSR